MLFFESIYDKKSKNSSVVDPEAHAKYKEDTKPVRTLESGLATTERDLGRFQGFSRNMVLRSFTKGTFWRW